ncbi:DNA repair protein RadA [Candidatus Uhrbacteria bacterium]|nr:DNA repair protein RadA [Candidatus Uhrbacteria bacterium]
MFACEKCDAQFPKWSGRCPGCQGWGTLHEEAEAASGSAQAAVARATPKKGVRLADVETTQHVRISAGDEEVNRVLGGGVVPGSLMLLSGEPGIGKSTLVAAIASRFGKGPEAGGAVLYVSGEESAVQLSSRFQRLGQAFGHVEYLEAEPVETIAATIAKEKPALAIIDSIQTVPSSELDGTHGGSPNLLRYATNVLLQCAKKTGVPILVIGQVTKEGTIAGPKTLEHLVDVVLSLEGDPVHAFRILRATKNRFGSTDEVGVFEMGAQGLVPVANPSERFLAERMAVPGSVITTLQEGSRVFLVEVQALVEKSFYPTPVRRASGFDQNRLQMLLAILSKRAGVRLGDHDVYVNVIGGMQLTEPASDLAVCVALLSATSGKADAEPTVYIGEVGLGGEVRSVPQCERRLTEAARQGMTRAVVPIKNKTAIAGLKIETVESVKEIRSY